MSATPPFLVSPLLDLPGIPHGFFSRDGGVSRAPYASLNTGPGSGDAPGMLRQTADFVLKRWALLAIICLPVTKPILLMYFSLTARGATGRKKSTGWLPLRRAWLLAFLQQIACRFCSSIRLPGLSVPRMRAGAGH